MTERHDWRASPNALEFLPEEIAALESGAMILCGECLWPRPAGGRCANCETYVVDQDRDRDTAFEDAP